jgi:type IX secretion system PorP/SprF family membrane protein
MKKFTLLAAGFFLSALGYSQDVFFTNVYQSLIYLNPSYAGSNGFVRNQMSYRNQWPNISGPSFATYMNAFDSYIRPIKGGVAFSAMTDDQGNGTLKSTWLGLSYAQYILLAGGKIKLVPSVKAEYVRLSLDLTKLNFGDAVNARYAQVWNYYTMTNPWGTAIPSSYKSNLNLSSGLLFYYSDFIFGASAFNINHPDIGLMGPYALPVRTCVHGSWNKVLNTETSLQVAAVYNNQYNWNRWQLSSTLLYKKMFWTLGVSDGYSGVNDLSFPRIGMIGFGLHLNKINLAYQYDVSVSKLTGGTMGSHEISVSFNFRSKKDSVQKVGMEYW